MWSTSLAFESPDLGCENLRYIDEDLTVKILSFEDLEPTITLPLCRNENLISLNTNMPVQIRNMDLPEENIAYDHTANSKRHFTSSSPPVAQLSSGLESEVFQFGTGLFAEELDGIETEEVRTKDQVNTPNCEDFELLLRSFPRETSDLERAFFLHTSDLERAFLLSCEGLTSDSTLSEAEEPNNSTHDNNKECTWQTRTTLAPEHLELTGKSAERQILQDFNIPLSVEQDTDLLNTEEELVDTGSAGDLDQTEPATSSKSRKRRRQFVEPGTQEYKKKRELNNISVRKSREKARQKQQETQERVEVLSAENTSLQARVDSLEKELTILKGLFSNIGATLPQEVTKFLSSK